jgi:hypothetical protein
MFCQLKHMVSFFFIWRHLSLLGVFLIHYSSYFIKFYASKEEWSFYRYMLTEEVERSRPDKFFDAQPSEADPATHSQQDDIDDEQSGRESASDGYEEEEQVKFAQILHHDGTSSRLQDPWPVPK